MDKEKAIKILNLNYHNYNNIFSIKKSYHKLFKKYYFDIKLSKYIFSDYYNSLKNEKKRKIDDINAACIFLLFLNAEEDKLKRKKLTSLYYSSKELKRLGVIDDFEKKIVSEKFYEEVLKDIKKEYRKFNIYLKTICNLIVWLIFIYKVSKNRIKDNFLILRFAFYSLISIHLNLISLIFLFIIEFIVFHFYQREKYKVF